MGLSHRSQKMKWSPALQYLEPPAVIVTPGRVMWVLSQQIEKLILIQELGKAMLVISKPLVWLTQ